MKFLRVKNLEKHQHYKDRRPPWIKLHSEVLDDYDFACLQDASKAHLMLIWVLASRLDNKIPYDLAWITKQLSATVAVDVEELIMQGFIEVFDDGSKVLAPRKQSAMPETERETETERKKKPSAVAGMKPEPSPSWLAPIAEVHEKRFGAGSFKWGFAGRTLKPIHDKDTPSERIAANLGRYYDATEPRFVNLAKFAETFASWDEPPPMVDPETLTYSMHGRKVLGLK